MSASNLCSIQGHTRIQYPPTDVAEITGAGVPGWVQPLGFVAFGAVFVAATHLILSDFESKPKLVRGGDTADGKARRRAGEDVCDAHGGREGGHLVVGVGSVLHRTLSIVWAERWVSVVFFVMLFVLGGATTLVESMVFLFFTKDLGASNLLCGLSVAITVSDPVSISSTPAPL